MRICTARTKSGRPCKAYAMAGTRPPRCVAHRDVTLTDPAPSEPPAAAKERAGFYDATYTIEEVADLVANAAADSLEDEIAAVRVAVGRVMKQLNEKLEPAEFNKLARLAFTGANTMARLMQAQHTLGDQSTAGLARAISQALDELSEELGVEL